MCGWFGFEQEEENPRFRDRENDDQQEDDDVANEAPIEDDATINDGQ